MKKLFLSALLVPLFAHSQTPTAKITNTDSVNNINIIKYYTEVIKANPNDASSYSIRGNAKMNLKLYNEALHDIDRSIYLKPQHNSDAFIDRGRIKDILKDYKGALTDYNTAIKINPSEHAF